MAFKNTVIPGQTKSQKLAPSPKSGPAPDLNAIVVDNVKGKGLPLTDQNLMDAIEEVTGVRLNKGEFLDTTFGDVKLEDIIERKRKEQEQLREKHNKKYRDFPVM